MNFKHSETKPANFSSSSELESKTKIATPTEPQQTIAIAATFTAEPIKDSLEFWLQELDISAKIEFAPYNQVFQQLLAPSSQLSSNRQGVNVILVNFEDWQKYDEGAKTWAEMGEKLERNVGDLIAALKTARQGGTTPYLVVLCPASPEFLSDRERRDWSERMEAKMASQLAAVDGLYLITSSQLTKTYPVADYYDPGGNEIGHIPYTLTFFAGMGTAIARTIWAIKSSPYKVIVLDCDNTLWKGVVGEIGAAGITIDPPYQQLQQFLIAQQESGMLLCLCSKNVEEDVWTVFDQRQDMLLQRHHLVSWRINWQPKSENLKSLAEELNLGLDSFIFIDDNPVECAEVQANCPEVLSLQLPQTAGEIEKFIAHTWAFDRLKVTKEDKKRTELYQQNVQRERLRQQALTFEDFLAGLGLEIEIEKMVPDQLSRVAQLTQRTNQFNLTTIRRSASEIQQLCEIQGLEVLTVRVKDRFGDYGLVGAVLFKAEANAIAVDTFLLSCRVLGRGVEHQMLAQLGKIAKDRGIDCIEIKYIPTRKNQPALDFLDCVGLSFKQQLGQDYLYRFPAQYVAELSYQPDLAMEKSANQTSSKASATISRTQIKSRGRLLQRIAMELSAPEQLIQLVHAKKLRELDGVNNLVQPRNELEKRLAQIWEEVLGVYPIGIDDNFFELGGDSIKAAILINKLQEQIGEIFHFIILFEAPTIKELAQYLKQKEPEAIAKMLGVEVDITRDQNQTERVDALKIARFRQLIPSLPPRQEKPQTLNKPALFVLSPPRSGSTLFRVMLSGHPQLFAPPELHLLSFNTLAERKKHFSGSRSFWDEGNIRALMEIKNCHVEQARELMQDLEARQLTIQQYYALMQEWIGERILVDKTPPYALDLETLKRAETDFENALFIHLQRHPYGMIRSHEESKMEQMMTNLMGLDSEPPFNRREYAELVWTICQQNIVEFLKQVPQERQLTVKFEDLVRSPQTTVERICEFLRLDFHPAMIQPYQDKEQKMTDGVSSDSRMMGDMKFKTYSGIDPEVAEKWRKHYKTDFLGDVTWEVAKSFGYEPIEKERQKQTVISIKPISPENAKEILDRLEQLSDPEVDAMLNQILTETGKKRTLLAQLLEAKVNRPNSFPLSFGQQRLWALNQLESDNAVYNLVKAIRLTGRLNLQALKQSLAEIVRRHEILRTAFKVIDGQPVQVISPEIDLELPIVDLRQFPSEVRKAEAQKLIRQEAKQPFALSQAPLLRVKLLRLADEEHILIRVAHHIIFDGWSTRLFSKELAILYEAFSTGKSSPLSELPNQYGDWVLWQNQWLLSPAAQTQMDYWRKKLADNVPVLQLPADKPRSVFVTSRGARQLLELPQNLTRALENFSRQERVTLFITLLAAFNALLYRYTGQEDLLLCSPVACRNRVELEGLIGYFNNIVVLRTDLSGDPSFRELLVRVRQVVSEAFEHQDLPFQKLTEFPNLARTPLTRGMFALQSTPSQPENMSGIIVSPQDVPKDTADFDLSLFVEPQGETLVGAFEYKTDLFSDGAIAGMLKNFQTILESLVINPELRLSSLPMFAPINSAQFSEATAELVDVQGNGKAKTIVAPRDRLELQLKQIWEKVLNIQPIDIRDNFFALGGHSMLAVRLFAEIEATFGKKFPLATLFQASTIEQLASLLRQKEWSASWASLVPIQPSGSKTPLFCVHGAGGNVLVFRDLARHLGEDRPFYGLQSRGLNGQESPLTTVEEMARCYLEEIKTIQPTGPYLLAGYCLGSKVALEMAQLLRAEGEEVALLALLEPGPIRFSTEMSRLASKRTYRDRFQDLYYRLATFGVVFLLKQQSLKVVAKLYQSLGLSLPEPLQIIKVEEANVRASRTYLAQNTYPGRVIMFLTSEQTAKFAGSQQGWTEIVTGKLEIDDVPGKHEDTLPDSFLKEPYVKVLAKKLRDCLERAL